MHLVLNLDYYMRCLRDPWDWARYQASQLSDAQRQQDEVRRARRWGCHTGKS